MNEDCCDKDGGEKDSSSGSEGWRVIVFDFPVILVLLNWAEDDENLGLVLSLLPVQEFPDCFDADVKNQDQEDQKSVDRFADFIQSLLEKRNEIQEIEWSFVMI